MQTVIVAVVQSELTAQDAAHALDLLADAGAIGLTAAAVVTKTSGGAISVLRSRRALPASALGGGVIGALIGVFTGPFGIGMGAAIGFAVGGVMDLSDLKLRRDFVASLERTLESGKSALVAQIDEDDTGPVNQQMTALGAVVLRRDMTDVTNEQYDKEVAALQRRFTHGHDI
jgi:uncharacterized membrane protein